MRRGTPPVAAARPIEATDPDAETAKLGQRIRDLRAKSGLTLADLAKSTGLSIGALSHLERGLVSPTIRTVYTVANALGVMPAWLIDPEAERKQPQESQYIVRAGQRNHMFDINGIRKDVASPVASTRLRGFVMVIQPGSTSGAQPYSHKGEELGLMLAGTLDLQIVDTMYRLAEGDCFAFPSHLPHRFENTGARPATVFWINADT